MFKRIIVATNLSKASYSFIGCLEGLKAYGTQEILLLQFLTMQESASIALNYSTDILERILSDQKEILEKQGFKVETRTVTSSVKSEINRIAKEENYAVVLVGAEKENLMKAHFFGGFAYDLISFAEKPVMLIRLNESIKAGEVCLEAISCSVGNHILFPTDFSENSETAFEFLKKMVMEGAKKITLVHIQDKAKFEPHLTDKLEEFNAIDAERLATMKKILNEQGDAEIETIIRYGSPIVEILALVKDLNIQLVVMGSQGRGFVKELFIGSVSNNVARRSDASVLLIPAQRA